MTNPAESNYLNLCKKILEEGDLRDTRNAKTLSIFGEQLRFNLREGFPLLTTKKMFTKGIITELIWFLNGKTDNRILKESKINIWTGNSTREYLDSRGLNHYQEDECGPIYGYQWRRFNAPYQGREVSIADIPIKNKGQDQIANIIHLIENEPTSRRMFMSGWNPCQAPEMCLEPCHVSYQFYVKVENGVKYLSCHMYQRSADIFLGVPFNIASSALLTHILANITGCKVDQLIISFGDVHIYQDHTEAVKEQLANEPYKFPQLSIQKKITLETIDELKFNDFSITGYESHGKIVAKMVV